MSVAVSGNVGSCGPLVTAREPIKARPTLSTVPYECKIGNTSCRLIRVIMKGYFH